MHFDFHRIDLSLCSLETFLEEACGLIIMLLYGDNPKGFVI